MRSSGSSGAAATRSTATFVPYFWEAYNEIVRPDRYDWYLVSRWLPDLGPEGFTILKALRNLCYFNPREGTLRDTCQITVDELAAMCGISRASLYRALEKNMALAAMVEKQPEAIHIEGRTRRLPPRWRVCMDTPIHPDDMEEYDVLRAKREAGRHEDAEERRKSQIEIYEKRKSQNEISGGRKSQNGERKSQNRGRKSQDETTLIGISLPSVSIPSESVPAAQASPVDSSPHISPQGEADALSAAWSQTLTLLAEQVSVPTYQAHIRTLRPVSLKEKGGSIVVTLAAPSAFTREWLEKRHGEQISSALAVALAVDAVRVEMVREGK